MGEGVVEGGDQIEDCGMVDLLGRVDVASTVVEEEEVAEGAMMLMDP